MKNKKLILIMAIFLLAAANLFAQGAKEDLLQNPAVTQKEQTEISIISSIGNMADTVTYTFRNLFYSGHYNLTDYVLNPLIVGLLTLEVAGLGLMMVLQNKEVMSGVDMLWRFGSVILTIGLIGMLPTIVDAILNIFGKAGFIAGGANASTITLRPSMVLDFYGHAIHPMEVTSDAMDIAMNALEEIANKADSGVFSKAWIVLMPARIQYWGAKAVFFLVKTFVLVSFIFTMVNVMMWIIELYFLMVVSAFSIPWKLFKPTSFLGSGVLQGLFGQGIKLFCLCFTISVCNEAFSGILGSHSVDWEGILQNAAANEFSLAPVWSVIPYTIFVTIVYCYFILKAPGVAKALVVGQPTMDTLGSYSVLHGGARVMGAAAMTTAAAGSIAVAGVKGVARTIDNFADHIVNGSRHTDSGISSQASSIQDQWRNSES